MTSLFKVEVPPHHEPRGGLSGPVLAEPPLLVLSLRAGAASSLQMGRLSSDCFHDSPGSPSSSPGEMQTWGSPSLEPSSLLCCVTAHPYHVHLPGGAWTSQGAGTASLVSVLPPESPQWEHSPLTGVTCLPSQC